MNTDNKSKIKAFLKNNSVLFYIYIKIMSAIVNMLKLFVKPDDKLILFVSFGGRRYADSPKSIYEAMKSDPRFSGYRLIWGFINPNDYPDIDYRVKIDTFSYYIISIKARCWITNVLIERGLSYKRKETFYLYTGHGSPLKKDGQDAHKVQKFKQLVKKSYDASLAQSEYEGGIRSRLLGIPLKEIYYTGSPTNDILSNYSRGLRNSIRERIGLSGGETAILYAPTFREYRSIGTFDAVSADFEKWHEKLGGDYIILYRAHPITMTDSLQNSNWFFDVTGWESIEELMIASDILVSDYSGLIPDYSIMHKPIYLWTYDYEEYEKTRGLYFDIRKELPYAEKEENLLKLIIEGFTDEQKESVLKFQQKYATVFGSATEKTLDLIYSKMKE